MSWGLIRSSTKSPERREQAVAFQASTMKEDGGGTEHHPEMLEKQNRENLTARQKDLSGTASAEPPGPLGL